jgi:prevent-host-death family protein
LEEVMSRVPEIVPVSDSRQDAAALLKRVKESRAPVVVTQRGRAAAVLLSVEAYERREKDLEILRLVALGEKEIAEGTGHSLEEVLSDADELPSGDAR